MTSRVALIDCLNETSEVRLEALSNLMGCTEQKLRSTFDINFADFSGEQTFVQPILVFIGEETWRRFGAMSETGELLTPLYDPRDWGYGENKRVAVCMERVADENDDSPSAISRRIKQRRLLRELQSVCTPPVFDEDVQQCFAIVEALGDDLSYWTKKILEELKTQVANKVSIDKTELAQLMGSYARDVGFIKKEVDNDAQEV